MHYLRRSTAFQKISDTLADPYEQFYMRTKDAGCNLDVNTVPFTIVSTNSVLFVTVTNPLGMDY